MYIIPQISADNQIAQSRRIKRLEAELSRTTADNASLRAAMRDRSLVMCGGCKRGVAGGECPWCEAGRLRGLLREVLDMVADGDLRGGLQERVENEAAPAMTFPGQRPPRLP